jgi:hypothetical protein
MSGEKNLQTLLNNMKPILNVGDYVFCTVINLNQLDLSEIIGSFKEKEGITLIVSQDYANKMNLTYTTVMAWITLEVHSSLEAVGLTAAFSKILAENNISCNVVAGYYHDHIFVMKADASRAIELLNSFHN